MHLMKKGAIELSMNFLIVLIISIVIFAMGIYLTHRFFAASEAKVLVMDDQMQQEIEAIMDQGEKVGIPFDRKTIGNKETGTFGVGILNYIDALPRVFDVYVTFNKAYDGNTFLCDTTSEVSCGNPSSWIFSSQPIVSGKVLTKTLQKYEKYNFKIGFNVKNARKGTYIFDLNVVCQHCVDTANPIGTLNNADPDDTAYGGPQKLYVEVKY